MFAKIAILINKFINLTYTERFRSYFILLLSLTLLTFLLSSRNFLFHNIIDDGVSKINVIATEKIEVEDTEKTDAKKRYESLKVKPILRPIQDNINDTMSIKLGEILHSLKVVKESKDTPIEKRNKIKNIFNVKEDNYFTNTAVEYIYKSSDSVFARFAEETRDSLDKILKKGVTENDLLENKDLIVESNISNYFSRAQKLAMTLLIKKVLEPNMEEDKNATELAIQRET